jgi:hypothetical protein
VGDGSDSTFPLKIGSEQYGFDVEVLGLNLLASDLIDHKETRLDYL